MTREMVLASVWVIGCASAFGVDVPAVGGDWKAMLPMVQVAVRHEFPKVVAQAHYPASIKKTADVDKGVSVALVDMGTGGYTEDLTVMRLEGATPVAARFRQKDDRISPMVFGNGVSDGKGEAVELIPKDHVVFAGHWDMTGKKLKCSGEAYQWDNIAKNFGYEKKLTKTMSREFCQNVQAKAGK